MPNMYKYSILIKLFRESCEQSIHISVVSNPRDLITSAIMNGWLTPSFLPVIN